MDINTDAERICTRSEFSNFLFHIERWPGNVPSCLLAIAKSIRAFASIDPTISAKQVPWSVFARIIAKTLTEYTDMAVTDKCPLPLPLPNEEWNKVVAAQLCVTSPETCAYAIELLASSYSTDWANQTLSEFTSVLAGSVMWVGDIAAVYIGGEMEVIDGPLIRDPEMPPWMILSQILATGVDYE